MAQYNVFVYGTLKRGEPNHHFMQNAKFVAEARTTEKYPLVIASRYNIPFLLNCQGLGHFIKGEVYTVDEDTLQKLDKLEEHPHLYEREEHLMEVVLTGEMITCWIYILKRHKPEMLELPFYDNYHSDGDHRLRYVAGEDDLSDAKDI